ncbi:hypothetical protein [Sporanaerobacter acetigenes]|uniref:Uncharacterized protein n=1 Tax=Sporanaerobacter acetigenes DSM 13106 TaxID=1123281 RepID=A0A1M5YIX8_9FIRM|nr:hypothetical protein [Sporanaerobacter acetigenes]SHI11987.1 hypothetical protein SAMN02745180_02228 [Sporanaerobacter acetigenes DSM 13106]
MEYLINGNEYGKDDWCILRDCDCYNNNSLIAPCTRIEPCACKANFCGAEICSPVKIQPASKKIEL